ncbi:hypothetical protein QOT17_008907 [Balamuthia mandrillaris]
MDFTPTRKKRAAYRFLCLQAQTRDWMKRVIEKGGQYKPDKYPPLAHLTNWNTSIADVLEDGSVLCCLVNALHVLLSSATGETDRTITLPASIVDTATHSYFRVDNIVRFLHECTDRYALREENCFDVSDLLSERRKNVVKVVHCICSLAGVLLSGSVPFSSASQRANLSRIPKWKTKLSSYGQQLNGNSSEAYDESGPKFSAAQIARTAQMLEELGLLRVVGSSSGGVGAGSSFAAIRAAAATDNPSDRDDLVLAYINGRELNWDTNNEKEVEAQRTDGQATPNMPLQRSGEYVPEIAVTDTTQKFTNGEALSICVFLVCLSIYVWAWLQANSRLFPSANLADMFQP